MNVKLIFLYSLSVNNNYMLVTELANGCMLRGILVFWIFVNHWCTKSCAHSNGVLHDSII